MGGLTGETGAQFQQCEPEAMSGLTLHNQDYNRNCTAGSFLKPQSSVHTTMTMQ